MNLLLLLSALLSALTGAQASARVATAPVAVSQVAERVVARVLVQAPVAGRPEAALPGLAQLADAGAARAWRLMTAVPLFLSRRRE